MKITIRMAATPFHLRWKSPILRLYDPVDAPLLRTLKGRSARAIDNPIGTPPLEQIIFPGAKDQRHSGRRLPPDTRFKILPVLLASFPKLAFASVRFALSSRWQSPGT
jgi:hypothetical protein